MKIGLAQINSTVGDFPGNARRILQAYRECIEDGADLVVTPELSLVGYPPKDLLLKKRFIDQCLQALDYLADEVGMVPLLVGYVDFYNFDDPGRELRNAAAFLRNGKIVQKVWKTLLPSYDVFDEARYFQSASRCKPIEFDGVKIGTILGYHAVVNPDLAGNTDVSAFIEVKLTPERGGGFDRLAMRIARFDQVESCYLASGGYDLMVVVEAGDLRDVARFVSEKLSTVDGVLSTATHFRLKTYKDNGFLFEVEEPEGRLAVAP